MENSTVTRRAYSLSVSRPNTLKEKHTELKTIINGNDEKSDHLRCRFSITHMANGGFSQGIIDVYNLTKSTSNKLMMSGSDVTLQAGYLRSIGVIFKGTVTNGIRMREGVDTYTRLYCVANGYKHIEDAFVPPQTMAKNTPFKEIISLLVKTAGIKATIVCKCPRIS